MSIDPSGASEPRDSNARARAASKHLSHPSSSSLPGEPYVQACGFCHDGLVRLYFCRECFSVAAICDECELLWSDIEQIAADPCAPTDDAFPRCPACNATEAGWRRLTREEIVTRGLARFIAGLSS